MPRPKKPGAPEPKRRSRNGCWPCKARKVKCGEERPGCLNCQRTGETCDYSIRLNWDGRRNKRPGLDTIRFDQSSRSTTDSDRSLGGSRDPASPPTSQPPQIGTNTNVLVDSVAVSRLSVTRPSSNVFPTSIAGPFLAQPNVSSDQHPLDPVQGDNVLGSATSVPGLELQTLLLNDATLRSASGDPSLVPRHDSTQPERPPKRARLDSDFSEPDFNWVSPTSPSSSTTSRQLGSGLPSIRSPTVGANPTPQSEDGLAQTSSRLHPSQSAPDFRRLSVNSLLSGPHESIGSPDGRLRETTTNSLQIDTRTEHLRSTTYYGVDHGFRDLDIGKNDDANAISMSSPKLPRRGVSFDHSEDEDSALVLGHAINASDFERDSGGYYNKPVVIRIPRSLEPLPAKLKDNPMNLLYFHHFLNHTARVLVPHDDPQSNPFRTILPQMAVKNDNLLSLLLAYSASHRARLLQQPEPVRRIAIWVQDIFPALRHALGDPTKRISNANVATAIMLASLEIISPTAFGYTIPWQKHLMLARDLITARPEGLRVEHHSSQEGQVCSFLWSWFAYLDVLGGLSGGLKNASSSWILDYKVYDPDDDDEIDCIMGFTTRLIYILSKIAELAKHCDTQRIGADGRIMRDWKPSAQTLAQAKVLEADVRESMSQPPRACAHIQRSGDVARWDTTEMTATNAAYHWAALIHLDRRVRGKPSDHADVQESVKNIISCVGKVRRGGTAEGCLLFPMFAAGCDSYDEGQRAAIVGRMMTVESTGMAQVNKARQLMQRVWAARQPWETLLTTEFIG